MYASGRGHATNLTSTPTTIPDAQSGYRAPATIVGNGPEVHASGLLSFRPEHPTATGVRSARAKSLPPSCRNLSKREGGYGGVPQYSRVRYRSLHHRSW